MWTQESPVGRDPAAEGRFRTRFRTSDFVGAALGAALALALPAAALADTGKPPEAPPAGLPGADRPQVVGGTIVSMARWRSNFRWVVSIQRANVHHCGGTLIARRYVLTAAHCVENWPWSQFTVLLNAADSTAPNTRIPITGYTMHPDYSYLQPQGFANAALEIDFAVMRLAEDAPAAVPTVRIGSTADITGSPQLNGLRGWALGWGATSEGGSGSARLRQVSVPVLSRTNCQSRYAGIFRITTNMVCAGLVAGGRDTCQGDSGGPIAQQDAEGRWIQFGVTSFGEGCARPNRPGVYARISAQRQWIDRAIQRRGSACYRNDWPAQLRTPTLFDCYDMHFNDDQSIGPIPIGFNVRLGTQTFNELHINTNGNVTFGGPRSSTWSSSPLSTIDLPIIAPYHDDVNIRFNRGRINYGQATVDGRPAFIVTWSSVGGFGVDPALRNTFQLVLIQRSATEVDVELNYGSIRWNRRGARAGVSVATGGPAREVPGSGGPTTGLIDGGPNALISNSNVGVPGRFLYRITNGAI